MAEQSSNLSKAKHAKTAGQLGRLWGQLWGQLAQDLVKAASQRFAEDRCLRMAASLSYTSLLAVVPLTAIAFAMLAAFPVFEGVREKFQDIVFANFLPTAADSMTTYLNQFVANTTTLSAVGIIALALTAVLLLSTIETAMNTIFRVARPRRLGPRLLVFWAVITLGPLLLGASFSLSTYFFAATEWLGVDVGGTVGGQLAIMAPTLILITLLALFYIAIPNRPVDARAALVGALVAGLLIAVLRKVFGFYVANFPTYQNIYGALSAIPIFLIWMYLSWTMVLLGAVLAATASEWVAAGGRPPRAHGTPGTRLSVALSILDALRTAAKGGKPVKQRHLLKAARATDLMLEEVLGLLRDGNYVAASGNKWVLSRDLTAVNLHDLYTALGLGLDENDLGLADEGWEARLKDALSTMRERNADAFSTTVEAFLQGDMTGSATDDPASHAATLIRKAL